MQDTFPLRVIARIKSDFPTKYGIPRQSGMVLEQRAEVIFEPEFRDANALRGLEGYSHLWLIWGFSALEREDASQWSPTVLPPRLGGNTRMGVFATRSPNRPNPIGLSSVKLEKMEARPGLGTVLTVSGADLMDATPIYDIKPYLSFSDSHPDARNGFAQEQLSHKLGVEFDEALLKAVPQEKRAALIEALSLDPRVAYRDDPSERHGFFFAGLDVRFYVENGVLRVCEVVIAETT